MIVNWDSVDNTEQYKIYRDGSWMGFVDSEIFEYTDYIPSTNWKLFRILLNDFDAIGDGNISWSDVRNIRLWVDDLNSSYNYDNSINESNLTKALKIAKLEIVGNEWLELGSTSIDDIASLDDDDFIEEPYIHGRILTPQENVGGIMKIALERRGVQINMEFPSQNRVLLEYELPLNEIVLDFYDKLKSISKGYASFDYEMIDYRKGKLVKLDILLNGEMIDALSLIVPKEQASYRGLSLIHI